MHLVVYGPEGSGKGTQAMLLSERYHLPIYTSGDLVRDAAKNDHGLIGEACRKALSEGRYVPDTEMFVLWKNALKSEEAVKGFVLDGFPRNLRQAKFLMRKTEKYRYTIDRFISIKLSDDEAVRRLTKRHRKLFPGSAETHDTPERITKRLSIFRTQEKEVNEFFGSQNILLEVNGDKKIEEVFGEIVNGLEKT